MIIYSSPPTLWSLRRSDCNAIAGLEADHSQIGNTTLQAYQKNFAFLEGLPLTDPQRVCLLGVRADTRQKFRDNR